MKNPAFELLEGSSLLGLSHISVNASMTINDTALTNGTISRLEAPDPIDNLDLTVCPADDILDGCKVSATLPFFMSLGWTFHLWSLDLNCKRQISGFVSQMLCSCICVACQGRNWRRFGAL